MFGDHDKREGHDNDAQQIHITHSFDPALQQAVIAALQDIQANNTIAALARRAKAISAHLTTVVAQLKQLSQSNT